MDNRLISRTHRELKKLSSKEQNLHDKMLKVYKIWNKPRVSTNTILLSIIIEVLARAIRQEKEIK
jgi:hypothetical protein